LGVLSALCIGEIVATLPFLLQYGSLAVTGIHTDGISMSSIASLFGVPVPLWGRRIGPFHFWWAWIVGAALARVWNAPIAPMVFLTAASTCLWRLVPPHFWL
jgi:hypothetical protein